MIYKYIGIYNIGPQWPPTELDEEDHRGSCLPWRPKDSVEGLVLAVVCGASLCQEIDGNAMEG